MTNTMQTFDTHKIRGFVSRIKHIALMACECRKEGRCPPCKASRYLCDIQKYLEETYKSLSKE